eukprot:m.282351 g.282351  ORF g.282351 m.282351 type:complete len:454 (+) comp19847_c0_seq3:181-1542(+)
MSTSEDHQGIVYEEPRARRQSGRQRTHPEQNDGDANLLNDSGAWDDRALITAYESAMDEFTQIASKKKKERLGQTARNGETPMKQMNETRSTPSAWKIGDICSAIWSLDQEVYRARIDAVDYATGTCDVTFIDYGNSENVRFADLQPTDAVESSQSDTLDTTYESSQSSVLSQRMEQLDVGGCSGSSFRKQAAHLWNVGDRCRCVWTEDGLVYDGTITDLDKNKKVCTVTFTGYGNTQPNTALDQLYIASQLPPTPTLLTPTSSQQSSGVPSNSLPPDGTIPPPPGNTPGHRTARRARAEARGRPPLSRDAPRPRDQDPPTRPYSTPTGGVDECGSGGEALPPDVAAGLAGVDESLAAMLMSWYQSGFHTGYYLAQQELTKRAYPSYEDVRPHRPPPDQYRRGYVPQTPYGHNEPMAYAPRHPRTQPAPPPHHYAHYPPHEKYYDSGGGYSYY